MKIRWAEESDIEALILMRWEFTVEDKPETRDEFELFATECRAFLKEAIHGGRWLIWVADQDGLLAAHVYVQLVDKVPRPGRTTYPYGYLTNVYTDPDFRSRGIGGYLVEAVKQWAKENHIEFLVVWPSKRARDFYARHGFEPAGEAMELHPPAGR
ncbi:GNAT family N-acetyltransferase [Paenibacillus sp. IB182496]|uniref:GNAT family N-acetyltransferase n=1 Tax=Paenibacillus sabuli TaxID=2772509 RepID=A0A927GR06_9BACL|nr:GNAT family N-acetyltransferase [Paenibacillus sabuli]MBD2844816.1 GNAT family N-acetyltransferase [Paenibacillus sabuli]